MDLCYKIPVAKLSISESRKVESTIWNPLPRTLHIALIDISIFYCTKYNILYQYYLKFIKVHHYTLTYCQLKTKFLYEIKIQEIMSGLVYILEEILFITLLSTSSRGNRNEQTEVWLCGFWVKSQREHQYVKRKLFVLLYLHAI